MIKSFKKRSNEVEDYIKGQNEEFLIKEEKHKQIPYDYIISKLDVESQRIIYSDYVVKQPQYWYLKFYSKSTYYRLKNIALDKFLELAKSL